jgi:Trypsin-like peptidase domain
MSHLWVRLRADRDGPVLGAGVLVDHQTVLTCAHVVGGAGTAVPTGEFAADLFNPSQSVPVRVIPERWVPPAADDSGDLALLRLAVAQPPQWAARLYRLSPKPGVRVLIGGFPETDDSGRWLRAELSGPREEWVQLDPMADGKIVEPGFSGGPVLDLESLCLIGIATARRADGPLSYMMPIESVLKYLPDLAPRAGGQPAVSSAMRASPTQLDRSGATVELARQLAAWLSGPAANRVWTVVAGPVWSTLSEVIRRSIALTDREWPERDDVADSSPERTVPPVGSIDLAVDATGRTVEQVAQLIVDRLRGPAGGAVRPIEWLRASAPPLTLVVEGVDDAAEPESLVTGLVGPLVDRGGRVLLVLRRASGSALRRAVEQVAAIVAPSVGQLLDALSARVDELAALEEKARELYEWLRQRFHTVPEPPAGARRSRLALARLRQRPPGDPALPAELAEAGRAVQRRRHRAEAALAELSRLEREYQAVLELRGRLDAANVRAAGLGERAADQLDPHYRAAYDALWQAPFDVGRAAELVRRYEAAVRELDHGGGPAPG